MEKDRVYKAGIDEMEAFSTQQLQTQFQNSNQHEGFCSRKYYLNNSKQRHTLKLKSHLLLN